MNIGKSDFWSLPEKCIYNCFIDPDCFIPLPSIVDDFSNFVILWNVYRVTAINVSRKWIEWAEWAGSLCTANSPFLGHVYCRHPVLKSIFCLPFVFLKKMIRITPSLFKKKAAVRGACQRRYYLVHHIFTIPMTYMVDFPILFHFISPSVLLQ